MALFISDEEKLITETVVLLVGLLYEMCKVQLVEKSESEDGLNTINEEEITSQIENSENTLQKLNIAA